MKRAALYVVVFPWLLAAQTTINGGRTILGALDASSAAATAPVKAGPADPAACDASKREMFYNTASNTLKVCNTANAWSAVSGGASGAFDPISEDVVVFRDEFGTAQGDASQGLAGQLGWSWYNFGTGTNRTDLKAGVWPNVGLHQLRAGYLSPAAGTAVRVLLGSAFDVGPLGALGANANWEMKWVFSLPDSTNVAARIGACGNPDQKDPANGIWVRYSTVAADTQFTFETRSAGVSTTSTANSKPVDTAFHMVRIRSVAAGTILFSIDGGVETSLATNVPAVSMTACASVETNTTLEKDLNLDLFAFKATVTR